MMGHRQRGEILASGEVAYPLLLGSWEESRRGIDIYRAGVDLVCERISAESRDSEEKGNVLVYLRHQQLKLETRLVNGERTYSERSVASQVG